MKKLLSERLKLLQRELHLANAQLADIHKKRQEILVKAIKLEAQITLINELEKLEQDAVSDDII